MAVDLSDAKGALKATAEELGISPKILTRWRRERAPSQALRAGSGTQSNREQQEILLLKKQLKQAELDRMAEATRYTKKGSRHLLQGRREIFGFIKAHQIEFPTVRRCG